MNLKIIAIGKIKEDWIKKGVEEYCKRISGYGKIEILELPDQAEKNDVSKAVRIEGENILSKLKSGEFVVLLDIIGDSYDSVTLSDKFYQWLEKSGTYLTFVIGGSNGVSPGVKERADSVLSLSPLTMPHQLARVFLLEQIYRSIKIRMNEPYHK